MGIERQCRGKRGEDIALEYLQDCGLSLRHRNWRCGHLELDLVMEDNLAIRIIEVKSITEDTGIDPLDHMTTLKISRVAAAARRYATEFCIQKEIKFDVVAIVMGMDDFQITYIPDAFIPTYQGKYY
ncbi:MAG: YraN family protein [Bacteroidales bacterium]|nr:YraN family protein [Bacteroidales bacterium]